MKKYHQFGEKPMPSILMRRNITIGVLGTRS
jgi:hypothetical protein